MERRTTVRRGPHDLGGMHGLGPVPLDDDSIWHERWEARLTGATLAAVVSGILVPPTHRTAIEGLHPVAYMSMSYFQNWQYALERMSVISGAVTAEEIEERVAELLENSDTSLPSGSNPEIKSRVEHLMNVGIPAEVIEQHRPPHFAVGDTVITKCVTAVPGRDHTRIPGYAQGRKGVIVSVHPPMILEDALVADGTIRLEDVYSVRLHSADIWPATGQAHHILVDLWDSYLDADDVDRTEVSCP
jgi:nitrile hydratase subunit beta